MNINSSNKHHIKPCQDIKQRGGGKTLAYNKSHVEMFSRTFLTTLRTILTTSQTKISARKLLRGLMICCKLAKVFPQLISRFLELVKAPVYVLNCNLDVFRNKKHHYRELSDKVKEIYGPLPNQFTHFWIARQHMQQELSNCQDYPVVVYLLVHLCSNLAQRVVPRSTTTTTDTTTTTCSIYSKSLQ